jgi:hypothetical protein
MPDGATSILYDWQQPPRPGLPFVPAPRRHPVTGVTEAYVPAGDLPVHDGRFMTLRADWAQRDALRARVAARFDALEADLRELVGNRPVPEDGEVLKAGIRKLHAAVSLLPPAPASIPGPAPSPIVPARGSLLDRLRAATRRARP